MRDDSRYCLSMRGCRHRRGLTDREAIGPFLAGAIASALFIVLVLYVIAVGG